MIRLIEKTIKDKLCYLARVEGASLDFLKYSTPSSHNNLDGKVLFFVFLDDDPQPSFVVKTVRTYGSKHVVENAYYNLARLNKLVATVTYKKMFPEHLYIYDDGNEFIFSIETYVDGVGMRNNENNLRLVFREYTNFQKSIYGCKTFDSFFSYAEVMIRKLDLEIKESDTLLQYTQNLSKDDFKMARLSQHSDLTADNVMLKDGELRVIDCDSFGTIELAGYDIYRLVLRGDPTKLFLYLDCYFKALGLPIKASKALIFLYYLHDLVYKKAYILKGKKSEDIIADFEEQMRGSILRILHITRMNYFSNKSHVYTTAKTVEAMHAVYGIECSLVSTDGSLFGNEKKRVFLENLHLREFPVYSLSSWDKFTKGSSFRIINWFETFFANIKMTHYVMSERKKFNILYFRDSTLFLPVLISKYIFHKPVFMESHAVLRAFFKRKLTEFIAKRVDGIISISGGLKEYYDKINKRGIVSFCSASDPEQFKDITMTQFELRDKYGLPKDKTILGYVGNLSFTGNYDSYGFEDVIKMMPLLDKDIIFVGIGEKYNGETKHLQDIALKLGVLKRVMFLPRVQKGEVAQYLKAFDVLIHPKAGAKIGNSPAKLFEWLLSGRPIIAANTRPIAEILRDGENAILVDYKDPASWRRAVERVLNDKTFSDSLVQKALFLAKNHTWVGRGQVITDFIKTNLFSYE